MAYQADTLVSGSCDHSARVWQGFNLLHELKGHQAPIWGVAIMECNNEKIILTAWADKRIKAWREGKVSE